MLKASGVSCTRAGVSVLSFLLPTPKERDKEASIVGMCSETT